MESIMFRIMNINELHRLYEELELIDDATEKEAREHLLDSILEKITDYDVHVHLYAYKQAVNALLTRGVILEPVERESIVAEWDKCFDSLVSHEMKQATKHYSDQFRWHLFSFELLSALQGEDARQMFDRIAKSELYLFFDYDDRAFRVKNAELLTADDFEHLREFSPLNLSDMYFFDPVAKWTYIKPHEIYCGPYYFSTKEA